MSKIVIPFYTKYLFITFYLDQLFFLSSNLFVLTKFPNKPIKKED